MRSNQNNNEKRNSNSNYSISGNKNQIKQQNYALNKYFVRKFIKTYFVTKLLRLLLYTDICVHDSILILDFLKKGHSCRLFSLIMCL